MYYTLFKIRDSFSRLHSVECVEVENPDGSVQLYPVSDKYFYTEQYINKRYLHAQCFQMECNDRQSTWAGASSNEWLEHLAVDH